MSDLPLHLRVAIPVRRAQTRALKAIGMRERVLLRRLNRQRNRRRKAEAQGSDRLSRPALHEMDRKLDALIDRDGGFFVEAGGHDGYTQSNTYWLSRFRGWSGILVEPMAFQYRRCAGERPESTVINAALVPPDHDGPTITMQFGDLMSTVDGSRGDAGEDAEWVAAGLAMGWMDPYAADVPARTLSSILDEVDPPEIDLLSLDVEGFEVSALRGLDLDRHAPRWLLVEVHDIATGKPPLDALLGAHYVTHELLSPVDVLYRRRDVAAGSASSRS